MDAMAGRRGRYFFDLGCGAQPRVSAGIGHEKHVCVDLSLKGLQQCKKILGDRGIYICGSLLAPPLRTAAASTALMAHCLYHIDEASQIPVLRAARALLCDDGELTVLYANPASLEFRLMKPIRALRPRAQGFYFVPLPISRVAHAIRSWGDTNFDVSTLRAFSRFISQPVFKLFRTAGFKGLRFLDSMSPTMATYVVYRLRPAAS
jgi:hypothetical protein